MEAAIRWCGLQRHEHQILGVVGKKHLPDIDDFPRWPLLRLNAERLLDALTNGDIPYGRNGVTCQDPSLLDDPDLTLRHVDLKLWMSRFYPSERPGFLFDAIERKLHTAISIEVVQALLADRESLQIQLADGTRELDALRAQLDVLRRELSNRPIDAAPSARSEATYLGIVGGMLGLMLGRTPSGMPYSSFSTQEAIISAMVAHYGGVMGITERTLQTKFAQAKRKVHSEIA
ncbi:FIG041388: hypothetical protein in PFGI-1-like cluster [plant metagenome]|uniref:Receptor protein-tyrosine kinase n=1 Tax=plant metagenome TaxID=1297885 RepID=A0A484SH75_9ZZZZ